MSLSTIFTPCFDRLLVKPDSVPDLNAGLIRPGTATLTRPRTGEIVRLGPACAPSLRVSQSVMHLPFDGKDMSLDGETVVYLSETSLLGIFEDRMTESVVERTFQPLWDNLLVKDDEVPEALTAGLVRPSTAQGPRARSGVVVSVGESVLALYAPGTRIIYGALDGADVTKAGEVNPEQGYRVISQMAILATVGPLADSSDAMGESWKDHIWACPGQMLVERAAAPVSRGLIIVPDGIRTSSRSSEALVVDVSPDISEFAPHDRVFLAGTVSKSIPLGRREDIVLWVVRPREITGRILVDPGKEIETEEFPHLAAGPELARTAVDTSAFEEGDTRAPR